MKIQMERKVDAAPEAVFARVSDFANAPRLIPAIVRVEMLTDGPTGVGTRFRETRVMFGREATEEMTVTAFDPPRSYRLGAISCGSRFESEIRVEPDGAGSKLSMSFGAIPQTRIAKIIGYLMRPMMKLMAKKCLKDLDDIKASIERGA